MLVYMAGLHQLSLVSAVFFPTRQEGRPIEGEALVSMSLACMSGLRSPCRGVETSFAKTNLVVDVGISAVCFAQYRRIS